MQGLMPFSLTLMCGPRQASSPCSHRGDGMESSGRASDIEWIEVLDGYEPRWTRDPSLSAITSLARKRLCLTPSARCDVAFFSQGGFNKLYSIDTGSGSYMMRVALPVEPAQKTLSEVATLALVRERCTSLVPSVVAFDAQQHGISNELEFEWILMDRIPGVVLENAWKTMTWAEKEELVKQVAAVLAKLLRQQFAGIGNLYSKSTESALPEEVAVGPIVSMTFFWHNRRTYDVPRGPFRSSYDWLDARLRLVLEDSKRTLETSRDEDEIEDAEDARALAERLIRLLPRVFPPDEGMEVTALCHDDLSWHNILVANGKLSGIVDWECVSLLPIWKVCQYPSFLQGKTCTERPVPPEGDEEDDLYKDRMREWEATRLRRIFDAEMERLELEWGEVLRRSTSKVDFELAVQCCDDAFSMKLLRRWLDYAENMKESWSLRERMLQ